MVVQKTTFMCSICEAEYDTEIEAHDCCEPEAIPYTTYYCEICSAGYERMRDAVSCEKTCKEKD